MNCTFITRQSNFPDDIILEIPCFLGPSSAAIGNLMMATLNSQKSRQGGYVILEIAC
jgi:hypothetical protein